MAKKKNLKQFRKSKWYKEQEKLAKEFKLSVDDIHNLYDLCYMINWQDYARVFKPNKMHKWFEKFFDRLESVCLKELGDKKNA